MMLGIADKTTLDLIKGVVDSVEGKVDDVYVDTGTIDTNVGSDVDAASASGSVHAKIKELRTAIPKNRHAHRGNGSCNSDAWATMLEVSGVGVLKFLAVYSTSTSDFGGYVRLTIDGTVFGQGRCYMQSSIQAHTPRPEFFCLNNTSGECFVPTNLREPGSFTEIPFSSSLKIEGYRYSGNDARVAWIYEHED